MHVILDLDETLINGSVLDQYILRPYVYLFLNFCFRYFETVSIWTAADINWWKMNYNRYFSKYHFNLVYTRNDCEFFFDSNNVYRQFKPLRKIWFNGIRGMNEHNTLFIDDVPENAIINYNNYLYIIPYKGNPLDIELLQMVDKLMKILDLFQKTGSVQKINLTTI